MHAYISTDLNMVKALDPDRHALALQMEAFLEKGGAIEVLQGPSFVPPPVRHDPPPTVKAKPVKHEGIDIAYVDKITQRDIDREERIAQRAKDKAERIALVRKLAATMTYSQAILRTGLPLRTLQKIAKENDFKFQPAIVNGHSNLKRQVQDDAVDAKNAERIKAFLEIGLSRNQAIAQLCTTFKTFNRLLTKFNIDYPKRRKGPHPAFFAKQQ